MQKQSLYLVGGALLASTALSTAAFAATIKEDATNGQTMGTYTAVKLGAQVFPSSNPSSVTLGGPASTGAALAIDLVSTLTTKFNLIVNVTGANFQTTVISSIMYGQDTGGSLTILGAGSTACNTTVTAEKLFISCDPTLASNSAADAVVISNITYNNASALGAAGASIALSGIIMDSSNVITFESLASTAVVTSANVWDNKVSAGGTNGVLTADVGATVPFSTVSSTFSSVVIATITMSYTGAVSTNLTTAIGTGNLGATEFKLSSPILNDAALSTSSAVRLSLSNTSSPDSVIKTASQFTSGSVTFTLTPASTTGVMVSGNVYVSFSTTNTGVTQAAAGTLTVTPTAAGVVQTAPAIYSGATASITRGGLNVEINTAQSSAGEGSTKYQSFVRITNTSTIAGAAQIAVLNDTTGATMGTTYTTASIPAGGTLQLGMPTLEAGAGITAAGQYKLRITGAFAGYVQHVMWNSINGAFSDLSGKR